MESIRIKNLRALGDTREIALKPINLLLGPNSTGKSTFLKTFPLFRQSVETRTQGPVLWFGELVDFGSYKDACKIGAQEEGIYFSFGITTKPQLPSPRFWFHHREQVTISSLPIKLGICLTASGDTTYPSGYDITFLNDTISFRFDSLGQCTQTSVNGDDLSDKLKSNRLITYGKIFQQFGAFDENGKQTPLAARGYYSGGYIDSFDNLLLKHCSGYFDARTQQERRASALQRISIGTPEEMLKNLRDLPNQDGKWSRRLGSMRTESDEFRALRNLILLARVPRLLSYADQYLVKTFSKAKYIKPLRATAERYYRSQNLAINEIDSDGGNLAMFLRSLRPSDQDDFKKWTMAELGFSVSAHLDGAHVSLRLTVKGSDKSLNLADLGFGFSQIIPVIAQIWHLTRKSREPEKDDPRGALPNSPRIIAIEQLELHLHPGMQALVIDLIARIIRFSKEKGEPLIFILETHSETIVNRIGHLISADTLDANDAQTLIFEKNNQIDETEIRVANYKSNGTLQNWPYGFFLPNPYIDHAASN